MIETQMRIASGEWGISESDAYELMMEDGFFCIGCHTTFVAARVEKSMVVADGDGDERDVHFRSFPWKEFDDDFVCPVCGETRVYWIVDNQRWPDFFSDRFKESVARESVLSDDEWAWWERVKLLESV